MMIVVLLMTLASCTKKNDDTAEIQLWYYDYGIYNQYSASIEKLIPAIKHFCERNNIPLNIVKFDKETLSYDDYILKRNLVAANGNMIIIEDIRYLWDLAEYHADYTKLENYNKLIDEYKVGFCIPLGVHNSVIVLNRKILDYYGIKLDKSIITYDEYLKIKQEMKENGAKFYANYYEFSEKLNYYKNKYGLMYINNESKIFNNKDKFKTALKSAIVETCDDFIKYNDGDKFNPYAQEKRKDYNINDENSELDIYQLTNYLSLTSYYQLESNYDFIFNNSDNILVGTEFPLESPCFYMYNKISNKRIYEIANFIVSESSYSIISDSLHIYSPVFDVERAWNVLDFDENLKYKGQYKKLAETQGVEKYINLSNLIDEIPEILIKNKETRKFLADYFFVNRDYVNVITKFMGETVLKLSENNFDYKSKEINEELDKDINEFINNFSILYK